MTQPNINISEFKDAKKDLFLETHEDAVRNMHLKMKTLTHSK